MTAGTETRIVIGDPRDFGRVAVMFGGSSSEREVSLQSGSAVLKALLGRGVSADPWDPAGRSLREFAKVGYDRVWIALHGPGGEDGTMQGALEWLGVPYTGSGVLASALAMDKVRSKHLFRATGISTPAYRVVRDRQDAVLAAEELGYPLVCKPAMQGSSIGMSKVFEPGDLDQAVSLALGFDDCALIERCIVGDEITVAVLQGRALPSIRIETPRVFYDYRAKYESDTTRYICPGTDDSDLEEQYRDLALRAFNELGCSGWGRVDLMQSRGEEPEVLEVNTVPGMTSHSLVPMAAKAAGIDFGELCWRVLETSLATGSAHKPSGIAVNGA
ncbi:MAG: D-alanine--D-alanine ligase [Gammaproteobacteria bacterium]|nr:D-alanine--D-alanine ligase [Gammaproteobacteria bacterium]MDH4253795.1 D-alanine--D-alanine ligase [Gammaproteobacteria bacterium]MDH5308632.1 D-alanine--D-alanine ligase [Gammaproteobacteria bacterium]